MALIVRVRFKPCGCIDKVMGFADEVGEYPKKEQELAIERLPHGVEDIEIVELRGMEYHCLHHRSRGDRKYI